MRNAHLLCQINVLLLLLLQQCVDILVVVFVVVYIIFVNILVGMHTLVVQQHILVTDISYSVMTLVREYIQVVKNVLVVVPVWLDWAS